MNGFIYSMDKRNSIDILGGGPAGLAVGYYAAKQCLDFRIFEARDRIGGLCKTVSYGDFHFDLGAHRFHDQDGDVTQEIQELLGDDLCRIDIQSQIYSGSWFIDFPLSPLNLIKNIGPVSAMTSGLYWLRSWLSHSEKYIHDFEQYAVKKYGRFIAERFLLNYSEKLWGLPCNRLSPDIAGKRLKGLSLTTFIVEAISSAKTKTFHLDGAFYYPKGGFGEIVDRMAATMGKEHIFTNSRVNRIFHHGHRLQAVEVNDSRTVETDRVISTLPLPLFLDLLEPACPEEVIALAKGLSFRCILLVMFFLNLDSVTRCGSVYFPGLELPFSRISEPRNRSRWMSPPGRTSLLVEIPCQQGKYPSETEKKKWVERVQEDLVKIGWIKEKDVLDTRVEYLDYAYPVLDVDYQDKLERIMKYLSSFKNLTLIGRNSLFKYTHFHDMMRLGRDVVMGKPGTSQIN